VKNTDITESQGANLDGLIGILAFLARLLMIGLFVALLFLLGSI
jgi:hypothetical protein